MALDDWTIINVYLRPSAVEASEGYYPARRARPADIAQGPQALLAETVTFRELWIRARVARGVGREEAEKEFAVAHPRYRETASI